MLEYKGFFAIAEFDPVLSCLRVKILNSEEPIQFDVDEIEMVESQIVDHVDAYLAQGGHCKEMKGNISFRTSPDRHARIAQAAEKAGCSVNRWMDAALQKAVDEATAGVRSIRVEE